MSDHIGVIEAAHYEEARRALVADPIIQQMFLELPAAIQVQLADGTLQDRFDFMTVALRQYNARGGTVNTHIGGPCEALEAIARTV